MEAAFRASMSGDATELERLLTEVTELGSWFADGKPITWTYEQLARANEERLDQGWPEQWAMYATDLMRKKPRGRPQGNRFAALLALEQRQKDGGSWTRLATHFCWCSKEAHNGHSCREQVRQQCMVLEETLRRLGV
jgi:hypothetical protein